MMFDDQTSHPMQQADGARAQAMPLPVCFVGAGPGDPDLLTVKAYKAIASADVIIHDRLVSAGVLAIAREDAKLVDVGKEGFGPSTPQSHINALNIHHARGGGQVVRLKGGDCTIFGRLDEEIEALEEVGIGFTIVPGITAASAAVAGIGQSLTRRGRNASARIITGHDMKGFADHDWRALAQSGEVAAIYMGKKAARFIQGRLMMHGASPETPVSVVENASRANQKVIGTTLANLVTALDADTLDGPALLLYGLAPREYAQLSTAERDYLNA
jgi:uroporphyrin-III C-methyltransferase/precorrin-2 dehydrogenase/sirohydrochlorin ferrochelatase